MSIIIFAGTSEGRKLAEFLSAFGLASTVYVATEYGELLLPPMPQSKVCRGRLTEEEMITQIPSDALVIDATHPYATIVTKNIRRACGQVGAEYIRLIRPRIAIDQPTITVSDMESAAEFLNTVTGSALLTTGSKELEIFTKVNRFAERLYPRVLPMVDVLQKCTQLGFRGQSIIAMQGPFTHEMNAAMLRYTHAKYLVTKDSGTAGGFAEKLSAAKEVGATVLRISRPLQETGMTITQVQEMLRKRFSIVQEIDQTVRRFPLFISLKDKKVVVIGGGHVAKRRIEILREFGADLTLVSPALHENIEIERVVYHAREYRQEDLDHAFLVVAATNVGEINAEIARTCARRNILCSVADCADKSTFYFPAICTGNGITAGVISDGTKHAKTAQIASRIRNMLFDEVDHEVH